MGEVIDCRYVPLYVDYSTKYQKTDNLRQLYTQTVIENGENLLLFMNKIY